MDNDYLDELQANIEDINIKDIKINPDFYTHLCYCNAIKSLEKDNIDAGLIMFRMNIETLETLTRARGLLNVEKYDEDIAEFEKSLNSKNLKEMTKQGKIANKKLELLSKILFSNKVITQPILDK